MDHSIYLKTASRWNICKRVADPGLLAGPPLERLCQHPPPAELTHGSSWLFAFYAPLLPLV